MERRQVQNVHSVKKSAPSPDHLAVLTDVFCPVILGIAHHVSRCLKQSVTANYQYCILNA